MSKNSVSSVVKSYLEKTNRPYSAIDVFNNLNTLDNKQSKTAITRALEELAANQLIVEKLNGKQKIYFADQNNFKDIDENRVQQINQELDQLEKELKATKNDLNVKESKLSSLKTSLTPEEVGRQLTQLNKEINELENRLKSIDSKAKDFDPQLNEKVKNERQTLVTEWKKRKRMAVNMIDMILEAYPKPKRVLIEEIGVETDEQMDLNLPQI